MGYNNFYQKQFISFPEKIIAALTYITSGFVGILWLILGAITKQKLKPFLKFHIYQSIFLYLLFFIVSNILGAILNLLSFIPILSGIIGLLNFIFQINLIHFAGLHLSLINIIFLTILIYLTLSALFGKYSYVPWVSNIIKANIYN